MLRRFRRPLVLAGVVTAVTGHVLCDLVFDCGCTWFFLGADAHCNVHTPAPPNCPPCAQPLLGLVLSLVPFTAFALVFAAAEVLWRRLRGMSAA